MLDKTNFNSKLKYFFLSPDYYFNKEKEVFFFYLFK